MTAFSGSRNLLLSVFKRRLCLGQTSVFRNVCSIRTDQRHNPRLTSTPASRQRWPHVYDYHLNTQRGYSDVHSEHSNSDRGTAVFQEESPETDEDSRTPSQKSPETFTLDVLVSLLRQENAVDLCVIRCPDQIKYADYFIVVTGISQRHIRAMALYAVKVYKFLKKDGDPNVKIEGKDSEDWMCIDFGNMVVHFMLPKTRDVYELEKLWTLRNYDEQLRNIPAEKLPEDFIYDVDITK